MAQTLNFILTGRDALSRVLDRAGDSAERMHRRINAAASNSTAAVNRFTTATATRMSGMQRDVDASGKILDQLKKTAISFAPAAIPVAASLVPIAAGAGAVAVAVGAMGAAMGPQIAQMGEAAEAHKKYEDAVDKSGRTSQEAAQAEAEYQRILAKTPPETQRAAVALGLLKDEHKDWSDSLAKDTMAPVNKGIALANSLLPRTRELVRGTAAETDRLLTIVGGEMASPGLDRLNSKFTAFATGTLRKVNDELVHLLRTGDGGGRVGGDAREFMDFARAQGPTVAGVLRDVSTALVHVLRAGSDVGVGLLQVVGVLASVVAAVPPGAIALFLQLAVAMRVARLAALGFGAARTALVGFGAQLLAMQAAAAGAPGRLAAVTAAIGSMSRGAKVALAGSALGLLVLAITQLSSAGRGAPADVDQLTGSLGRLGQSGKAGGEAARLFGEDLSGLYDKIRSVADPATIDSVQQGLVKFFSLGMADSTPVKEAKERIDAIDESLANLVKGGRAQQAADALAILKKEYRAGGGDVDQLTSRLNKYKSAIADAKFEQQLAAQSMGLFGTQALAVQAKLDAQKRSADGLRQSLQALNDTQRQGLGGMIGFEAAIDAAGKAAREGSGALSMSGGKLNLNSEKARSAATALNDLAAKTDEAAAQARQSGASWETVNGIYNRGRETFLRSAQAMGLTKTQAGQLADQILKIPDKKSTQLEMKRADALAGLDAVIKKIDATPGTKSVTVKALSKSAITALEDLGFKVKRLPDGRVVVTSRTGEALNGIGAVKRARDALKNKQVDIGARDRASGIVRGIIGVIAQVRSRTATITTIYRRVEENASPRFRRRGGPVPKFAGGGMPGGMLRGPGTGTSDSIPMWWGSNGEYIVNAASTRKHRPLIEAINADRLGSGGGMNGAGAAVAQGLAQGIGAGTGLVEASSRALAAAVVTGIRDELEIASPSKKTRALAKDVGRGLIKGMTGSRAQIKATSKDLAKDIWSAFSGRKDNRLVAYVNRHTKTLLSLAGKRDSIAATIKRANEFAENTRVGAKKASSLGSMFGGEEKVTARGIQQKLAARLTKLRTFTSYIKTLAKRGLNKTMLREILEMGPE
ncbi:hypothetical protein AB0I84_46005, partial [Streptomyces spectabilis]